jgi:hypothetical protein
MTQQTAGHVDHSTLHAILLLCRLLSLVYNSILILPKQGLIYFINCDQDYFGRLENISWIFCFIIIKFFGSLYFQVNVFCL